MRVRWYPICISEEEAVLRWSYKGSHQIKTFRLSPTRIVSFIRNGSKLDLRRRLQCRPHCTPHNTVDPLNALEFIIKILLLLLAVQGRPIRIYNGACTISKQRRSWPRCCADGFESVGIRTSISGGLRKEVCLTLTG